MSVVEQIFAIIGIASTVLLVIQVILLIFGLGNGGADGSADAPDSHSGGFDSDGGVDAAHTGLDIHVDTQTGDISVDAPDGMPDINIHPGDWYGDGPTGDFVADGVKTDTSLGGLHLFTLQGFIAFFAVFGWSGLLMLKADVAPPAGVALAIVFGILAMLAMAWVFKAMLKLQQDGSLDIRNALGKSGTVYLTIPAGRSEKGKVSIVVQDRLMELEAVTDQEQGIKTGAEVTVVGISNKNTLIVVSK